MKNTTTTNTAGALLVRDNINQLKCKELKTAVRKMLESSYGINKNMWVYAINANNIIQDELYKDDYINLANLASALGTSKGTLSKYSNAVQLMVNSLAEFGYNVENITLTNVIELLPVKDNIAEFMKKHINKDFSRMTASQVRKLVKLFNNPEVVAEQEAEQKTEQATEKADEKTVRIDCIEDEDGLHIYYKGDEFLIDYESLVSFKVKEEEE